MVIIDTNTGRGRQGTRWEKGLHNVSRSHGDAHPPNLTHEQDMSVLAHRHVQLMVQPLSPGAADLAWIPAADERHSTNAVVAVLLPPRSCSAAVAAFCHGASMQPHPKLHRGRMLLCIYRLWSALTLCPLQAVEAKDALS